jgi:protein TonB
MIEKKSSKGNLDKRKTTFLIIGFIVVLGLVYAGFEFFAHKPKPMDLGSLDPVEIIVIDVSAPVTDQTPPPPPPPQQTREYILQVVDDMTPTLGVLEFPGFDEDEEISPYEYIPPIPEPTEEAPIILIPEKNPEPIGGYDAMYAFLKANLKYPDVARTANISGTVFVEFVVEKDGSISNLKILASVHSELDKEAMRVVKMMPKWKPGEQLGKPVRCLFNIPIRFTIN